MLPSWIRSRNGTPRPTYFLATLTTRRLLALIRCSCAAWPSRTNQKHALALFPIVQPIGQLAPRVTPVLHALGQVNFFLRRQQRDTPDFLQVQADGIVNLDLAQVESVVLDASISTQRFRPFPSPISAIPPFRGAHRLRFFFACLPDVDALLKERGKDVFQLLHVAFGLGHHLEHVVIGDVSLGASQREQMLQRLLRASWA